MATRTGVIGQAQAVILNAGWEPQEAHRGWLSKSFLSRVPCLTCASAGYCLVETVRGAKVRGISTRDESLAAFKATRAT